jgi:hypothetical protein
MRKLARMAMVTVVGIALTGAAVYSALPERISPVQATRNGDAETAVKIVGDGGGRVTRTFKLPPAPGATPRLGLALRPATYLKRPTGTITVVVGERDRCTFRPSQYTDGGTITCPGPDRKAVCVRRTPGRPLGAGSVKVSRRPDTVRADGAFDDPSMALLMASGVVLFRLRRMRQPVAGPRGTLEERGPGRRADWGS